MESSRTPHLGPSTGPGTAAGGFAVPALPPPPVPTGPSPIASTSSTPYYTPLSTTGAGLGTGATSTPSVAMQQMGSYFPVVGNKVPSKRARGGARGNKNPRVISSLNPNPNPIRRLPTRTSTLNTNYADPGPSTPGYPSSSNINPGPFGGGRRSTRAPQPRRDLTSGPGGGPGGLRLKFSSKGEVQSTGGGKLTSFLGEYSREADDDPEEPLVFEEQFILRVPERVMRGDRERGEKGIRTLLEEKKEVDNVWFKFKDPRRAVFHHGETSYPAQLVDLPCIIEAQKTLDRKRLFKVADISQMLVVDKLPLENNDEDALTARPMRPEEHVFPHGLTPPMRHVRERRWRQRREGNKIQIQVAKMLAKDKEAAYSTWDFVELHDRLPNDLDGSEGEDENMDTYDNEDENGNYPDEDADGVGPAIGMRRPWNREGYPDVEGDGDGDGEGEMEGESVMGGDDRTDMASMDGEMDPDLAHALDKDDATDNEDEDEDDDADDNDDDEAEEEEEDEELVQLRANQKLLDEEVQSYQAILAGKKADMERHAQGVMRLRLQPGVDKAKSAFDAKLEERNANQKKIDDKMEAKDKAKAVNDENDDDDADSLFGEDDDEAEEGEAGGDADGDVDMDGQDDAGVADPDADWEKMFENLPSGPGTAAATPGAPGNGNSTPAAGEEEDEENDDAEGEEDEDEDDDEEDEDEDGEGDGDEEGDEEMDVGGPAPAPAPVQQAAASTAAAPQYTGYSSDEDDEDDD